MNAMAGWTFDARTVAPQVGMDPVPEGWYKGVIRKSNIKPTRDGANGMLELVLEILEGQFTGRMVFWNFNLFHQSSQQAVEIAYKQLSAVCYVTGVFQIAAQQGQDAALPMLHNIPFYFHAVVATGNQGPINNIRGVKDINGNEPGKSGAGAGPQAPAPQVQPGGGFGAPSQLSAPGGWGGAPQGGPQGGAPQWGAPQGGPAPGPAPGPAQGGWGTGQPPGAPAPGPAQQWGAPQGQGGAPQGGPQWGGAPQGQGQPGPGGPMGGPGPGQQWQPPGGQPGGPPQGGAPWGR